MPDIKGSDRFKLYQVYRHVEDIDLFVGASYETPLEGSLVGRTFGCILGEQFRRAKFGDRFWHEREENGFTEGKGPLNGSLNRPTEVNLSFFKVLTVSDT